MMHYAKAVAHSALGSVDEADAEKAAFLSAKSRVPESRRAHNNTFVDDEDAIAALNEANKYYFSEEFNQLMADLNRGLLTVRVSDALFRARTARPGRFSQLSSRNLRQRSPKKPASFPHGQDSSGHNAFDRGLDTAALAVAIIRQVACPRENRLNTTRQDRDAVPGALPSPEDRQHITAPAPSSSVLSRGGSLSDITGRDHGLLATRLRGHQTTK